MAITNAMLLPTCICHFIYGNSTPFLFQYFHVLYFSTAQLRTTLKQTFASGIVCCEGASRVCKDFYRTFVFYCTVEYAMI